MNDRYVHLYPFTAGWDQRQANLVTLGRYLVMNAGAIRAAGGPAFGHTDMTGLRPTPVEAADETGLPLPPLAYGPLAGLPAEPGEDWPAYVQRTFGVHEHEPFMVWLQSAMWRKTEPSPEGAALRIAYALDYGVPHDYVEIAMAQAHTDYDSNGFLWEKLDILPDDDWQPRRQWPAWVGAVEQARRRAAIKADYLLPPGEAPFSAGFGAGNIAALRQRRGQFPDPYSDFLLLSGRRNDGSGPYADRLDEIDRKARQRIFAAERPEDDPVPEDAFFIGLESGRHPEFILGGKRPDSPVFRFDADTGRVTQTGISVFTWIDAFMQRVGATTAASPEPPVPPPSRPSTGLSLWQQIRRWFG